MSNTMKRDAVMATLVTSAAEVRVGDYVVTKGSLPVVDIAKVVGVTRMERGVALYLRDEAENEHTTDHSEHGEVEVVSRYVNRGTTLYRVPHPTRSGVIAWVSIPEEEG